MASEVKLCSGDFQCPVGALCYADALWLNDYTNEMVPLYLTDGISACFCNSWYGWYKHETGVCTEFGVGVAVIIVIGTLLFLIGARLSYWAALDIYKILRHGFFGNGSVFLVALLVFGTLLATLMWMITFLFEIVSPAENSFKLGNGDKGSSYSAVTVIVLSVVQVAAISTVMSVTISWIEMAAAAELLSTAHLNKFSFVRKVLYGLQLLYMLLICVIGILYGALVSALVTIPFLYVMTYFCMYGRFKLVHLMTMGLPANQQANDSQTPNAASNKKVDPLGLRAKLGLPLSTANKKKLTGLARAIANVQDCSTRLTAVMIGAVLNSAVFTVFFAFLPGGWMALSKPGSDQISYTTLCTIAFVPLLLSGAWAVREYSSSNIQNLIKNYNVRMGLASGNSSNKEDSHSDNETHVETNTVDISSHMDGTYSMDSRRSSLHSSSFPVGGGQERASPLIPQEFSSPRVPASPRHGEKLRDSGDFKLSDIRTPQTPSPKSPEVAFAEEI